MFHSIEKTPPDGVVVSMIFGIENHRYPSHYDLHIKTFNSVELNVLIEYQYKKGKIESRVGEKAPARFLSIAEEDSVSEIAEVTHSEADPFQDFGFVVAALNQAI